MALQGYMSGFFTSIRFVLALLTVLAIAAKPLIPPRTLLIHPSHQNSVSIYGPADSGGSAGVQWLDKTKAGWRCDYVQRSGQDNCGLVINWSFRNSNPAMRPEDYPPCLFDISDPDGDGWGWENELNCRVTETTRRDFPARKDFEYPICESSQGDPNGDGWGWEYDRVCHVQATTQKSLIAGNVLPPKVDASPYDGFLVKIHYEGRADYIHMNLRDAGPTEVTKDGTEKFMSALMRTEDLRTGPVFVGFNAFTVDEWWVFQQNPPRELAGSEFKHLVQVGVHYTEPGVHRMRVDEIKLIGERVSNQSYLMAIMMIWISYLLLETGWRYHRLRRSARSDLEQLQKLAKDATRLEQEKHQLENRSTTDMLTGVHNRSGFAKRVQEQYGGEWLPQDTGLVVMDIDHFKKINDTYGHGIGDQVLRAFAECVAHAVRDRDIFARWGGEEFVLVVDATSPEKLRVICEKLRQRVVVQSLLPQGGQTITVSMGAVFVSRIENFDTTFKKADDALYRAKIQRDTVVYAD